MKNRFRSTNNKDMQRINTDIVFRKFVFFSLSFALFFFSFSLFRALLERINIFHNSVHVFFFSFLPFFCNALLSPVRLFYVYICFIPLNNIVFRVHPTQLSFYSYPSLHCCCSLLHFSFDRVKCLCILASCMRTVLNRNTQ